MKEIIAAIKAIVAIAPHSERREAVESFLANPTIPVWWESRDGSFYELSAKDGIVEFTFENVSTRNPMQIISALADDMVVEWEFC